MAIRFAHDQFRFDPDQRRFLLVEPPALFDEPPDRIAVQAWRIREGWQLVYTHKYGETDTIRAARDGNDLGVVDLWCRPDE